MNAEELYGEGLEQYWNGDFEGAIASCDRALAIRPDYLAWNLRKQAIDKLESKSVGIKAGLHIAWNKWGMTLSKLGRYEQAIVSFDKALEIKSDYYQVWYNRA